MIEAYIVTAAEPGSVDHPLIAAEFPSLRYGLRPRGSGGERRVHIDAAAWRSSRLAAQAIDARIAQAAPVEPTALCLCLPPRATDRALAVLTRYQRFIDRRNARSHGRSWDDLRASHLALHDLRRPLSRIAFDRAIDRWQWLLRLCPEAGLAEQLAALFLDVERLHAGDDVRAMPLIGERARKDARGSGAVVARHVISGVAGAGAVAARAGEPPAFITTEVLARVEALLVSAEPSAADPERTLLRAADALSFFSLDSGAFLDDYGLAATRRRIAIALARLTPACRDRLRVVGFRPDVAAIVAEVLRDGGERRLAAAL